MKTINAIFQTLFVFCFVITSVTAQYEGTSDYCNQNLQKPTGPKDSQNLEKDGNGSLGNSYSETATGLDYVTASKRLGQRFNPVGAPQPATFDIAGIPGGAVIEKAFLYSSTSGNGVAVTATIENPISSTQNFPMTLIGSGPDKCWGYSGSHSYRADVTAIISGNGTYMISGLPVNFPNDTDGATLMVIYSVPGASFDGTIHIADGSVVQLGFPGTTEILSYPAIAGAPLNPTAFIGMADVQNLSNDFNFNGTPVGYVPDWWNYLEVNTSLSMGQSSSTFIWTTGNDCVNWVFMGIYYQEENCTDPQTLYKDADDDGYTDGSTIFDCPQPGYKTLEELNNPYVTDCDDNDPLEFPGQTWYKDADNDNYSNGTITTSCLRPAGYKAAGELLGTNNDCNDNNAATNPGASEICDGQDNNCNGTVDEGAPGGQNYVGNVIFTNQAQINAWPSCYGSITGNLTIQGGGINNLGPLSNISGVTGNVVIMVNTSLTTLSGLGGLSTVGGSFNMYYNFNLSDCCAIDDLLTNGGVGGNTLIFYNKAGSHCNSAAAIMAACPMNPLTANPNGTTLTGQAVTLQTGRTMALYPNPARNEVQVRFDRKAPMATLRIMDMLGRTVFEMELEEGMDQITIDLNSGQFENGIYLVSLFEDGEMTTKQLVVQQ